MGYFEKVEKGMPAVSADDHTKEGGYKALMRGTFP